MTIEHTLDIHLCHHCSHPKSAPTLLSREKGKVSRYSLISEDKNKIKRANTEHRKVCHPGPGNAHQNPV